MPNSGGPHPPPDEEPSPIADWRGAGDLAVLAVDRLTAPVAGMHRVITDRWFRLAGSRLRTVRAIHDATVAAVYASIRAAPVALAAAIETGAAVADARGGAVPLWQSRRGARVQGIANAVWGDELVRRGSDLGIQLGLRTADGVPIPTTAEALRAAYPEATGRLAVLVHGLAETEYCWSAGSHDAGLSDGLTDDGFTALLVRYNTGRTLLDNGASLAALLSAIHRAWPVAVEEISLIGNSMGGLVARSAVHAGRHRDLRWASEVRNVVALASPHLGAPLEKGAHLLSIGLRVAPDSRPLGEFVDSRSAGIKDLRLGTATLDGAGLSLPGDVAQHFVAGVVTTDPRHPVGLLVGDLVVRVPSGTGRGRRRRVEATNVRVLGGRRHFDLVHDPEVHAQVREWLRPCRDGDRGPLAQADG